MYYVIMRKNSPITVAKFSDDGDMLQYSKELMNDRMAPLEARISSNWLKDWWRHRSVPISQGEIADMLQKRGMTRPGEYLVNNLGLSLTDYYWIKPLDSDLTWEDVNLFENNFRDNLLVYEPEEENVSPYTPNSSLQGQLEKTWQINQEGERILIKGNGSAFSSESINEVIASKIHELQGYDNYTEYQLLPIKDKPYDYGCYSKQFTSSKLELVSAYAVVTSEKQSNNKSLYEHFIDICGKNGIDMKQLRKDLEYQIMTDFILSNRDRHLNNIGILRDAETMQFVRMAPVFDSGKSLFVQAEIPIDDKELLSMKIQSFASSELKLLSYVTDKTLVDISKLPGGEYVRNIYRSDTRMTEERIERIVRVYERKIQLLDKFQKGENLKDY